MFLTPAAAAFSLDRGARLGVEVDDGEHAHAVGDHLIGDGGHVVLVAFGVLDVALDAGVGAGRLDQRTVERFPADRRGGPGRTNPAFAPLPPAGAPVPAGAALSAGAADPAGPWSAARTAVFVVAAAGRRDEHECSDDACSPTCGLLSYLVSPSGV